MFNVFQNASGSVPIGNCLKHCIFPHTTDESNLAPVVHHGNCKGKTKEEKGTQLGDSSCEVYVIGVISILKYTESFQPEMTLHILVWVWRRSTIKHSWRAFTIFTIENLNTLWMYCVKIRETCFSNVIAFLYVFSTWISWKMVTIRSWDIKTEFHLHRRRLMHKPIQPSRKCLIWKI